MTPRKAATRAALQSAALDLCEVQGFDATTVEQIAAAAGVTPMTFFRHFATKSAVVMDDPYDPVIGEAVAAQPAQLAALERACRGLAAAWARLPTGERADTWRRVRIIAESPTLRAQLWQNTERTQAVIARALTDSGVGRQEAQVAAGACLGAVVAALLEWGRSAEGELNDLIAGALAQLSPGSAAREPRR